MRFSLIAIAVALTVSGCATVKTQAIGAQEKLAIQGQSVVVTSREKPNFSAMTAVAASFAVIGALAAISEGNSIVEKNEVADPADFISSSLAKSLEAAQSVKIISASVPVASDDPSVIASSAASSAAYVLDVQTTYWSFDYFPTDWTHYRVLYAAKARLIDTRTKSVVALGICSRVPDSNTGAPTYDELMANQAAGLKRELEAAAKECVNTLKAEMLAI